MALTRTTQTDSKTKLGRYELLRELATSSVGTSWLARPIGETFEVTLLKVHRHMAKTPAAVEALLSEAQAARKFAHDNVAGVLDAGVVDGEPFIVTEYVGESLASLLRAAGPAGLPIPIALRISIDILEGFAAAHTNDPPIGHGEIGPWCVFVGSDGVARVGGFGVDRAIWRFGAHYVKNMERLSYAAPERVKSMSSTLAQELSVADEQSDLFGAAVLVFELLTRQRLFASKMEAAVVQKVLTSPIPTAQSFRPEIPLEVSDALKQALVRDRSERLVCFEDFIVALEGAGPDLIGSNEAVADMVTVFGSSEKSQEKRSIPPPPAFMMNAPGSIHEMLSSAGTPGAATKPAPVPGRATLMFDEVKDGLAPPRMAPIGTASAAAATGPAAVPTSAVVPPAPAAAAPPPTAGSVGPAAAQTLVSPDGIGPQRPTTGAATNGPTTNGAVNRPRAKTLMGFGALKVNPQGSKESPPAPPVAVTTKESLAPPAVEAKPKAIEIPAARSSSIELRDSDFDVQIEDPLSLPTTIVDLPSGGAASALPAAPGPKPAATIAFDKPKDLLDPSAKPAPKVVKPPNRRTSTLLGIQAPLGIGKDDPIRVPGGPEAVSFDDEPTGIMADATTSAEASKPAAPNPSPTAGSAALPLGASPMGPSPVAPVAASAPAEPAVKEPNATTATAEKNLGKRALFSNEMLRTGAILRASGTGFELIAPVARGGMATVWAAREVGSKGLEKMVAIKTMLPELSDDVDFESMFLDEARVAARIRHPNVASIIDLGQEDSLLYLVMEWVDGENIGTIQRAARVTGGMPTAIIVQIATEICSGLHEAHELKDDHGHSLEVVHRDISPANVIVGRDGRTRIVDFGIAKSKGRLHVTKVGAMVKGKTPYLSPEQIGGLPIDRRSDLFSLGALLYVMSSGLHPFRGETELSTIENIAIKAPVPLRSILPDIDPGFEQLVLKLLEKDPKKRFQTAREVQDALEKLASAVPQKANQGDVAAFLEKVVGDKLDQRIEMLKGGLERIERRADGLTAEPLIQENTPSPASALDQVLERVRQSQPEALDAISFAEPQPGKAESAPEAPASEPAAKAATEAIAAASPEAASLPEYPEEPIETPAPSNVKRLAVLIGVGLVIGLVIIGALEAFRGGGTTTPSASVSAAQPSAAPPPPTPPKPTTPTAEPTPTTTATEPTAAPSETAATPTAEPTATPSAAPTPKGPVGPGTRPPTGPHPPATPRPRPPPRKYNPVTI